MQLKSFDRRIQENILITLADSLDSEMLRVVRSEEPKTLRDFSDVLKTFEAQFRKHLSDFDFNHELANRLGDPIRTAVNFLPNINNSAVATILRLYHGVDCYYKQLERDVENDTSAPILTPDWMVRLALDKNKCDSSVRDYLITNFLSYNDSTTGYVNSTVFKKDIFKSLDSEHKLEWLRHLNRIFETQLNFKLRDWMQNNLYSLIEYSMAENLKDIGMDLMRYTVDFEKIKDANDKNKDSTLEVKGERTSAMVYKLRAWVFGDLETFNKNLKLAESLDCAHSKEFWKTVAIHVNTDETHVIDGFEL